MTGGVKFQGKPVMGVYDSRSPPQTAPELPISAMRNCLVSLRDFKRQLRIYHNGQFFSCVDIIKFVANQGGGAHLDYRRSKHEKAEAAFRWCTFGGTLLDLSLRPKGALHFEVEPTATDTLTSFHIEIIAATASFVQLRVDGEPLLQITVDKSYSGRLRALMGLKKRIKMRLYELRQL